MSKEYATPEELFQYVEELTTKFNVVMEKLTEIEKETENANKEKISNEVDNWFYGRDAANTEKGSGDGEGTDDN